MRQKHTSQARAASMRLPLSSALPLGEGLVLAVILFIVLAVA